MEKTDTLYVMISKTDTGIGKLIRGISGYPYNHVSLTLDPTFRTWVSFARVYAGIPLYGSFIRESTERYLAKGKQIDVRIFAVPLTERQARQLRQLFALAGKLTDELTYNHLELLASAIGLRFPVSGAYTCLGFARTVLGKDYDSIQALDIDLTPLLFYQGTLNQLAPDSGSREDIYFTQTGLLEWITYSARSLSMLFGRLFAPAAHDAVTEISAADLTKNL